MRHQLDASEIATSLDVSIAFEDRLDDIAFPFCSCGIFYCTYIFCITSRGMSIALFTKARSDLHWSSVRSHEPFHLSFFPVSRILPSWKFLVLTFIWHPIAKDDPLDIRLGDRQNSLSTDLIISHRSIPCPSEICVIGMNYVVHRHHH